jgi:glyoxylase I family protein
MTDVLERVTSHSNTVRMPERLHHTAWVVEDQERTRAFYEDVLGFKLTAFWIEAAPLRGKRTVLSHAFYGLEDGGALAFFCLAEKDDHEIFKSPKTELFNHIALKVDEATQDRLLKALIDSGYKNFSIEHGYCKSLYVTDPDGLNLEFAIDAHDVDRINSEQLRDARDWLTRWNHGEREPNNEIYTHKHRTSADG